MSDYRSSFYFISAFSTSFPSQNPRFGRQAGRIHCTWYGTGSSCGAAKATWCAWLHPRRVLGWPGRPLGAGMKEKATVFVCAFFRFVGPWGGGGIVVVKALEVRKQVSTRVASLTLALFWSWQGSGNLLVGDAISTLSKCPWHDKYRKCILVFALFPLGTCKRARWTTAEVHMQVQSRRGWTMMQVQIWDDQQIN